MKELSVSDVMALRPCYSEDKIIKLFDGRDKLSLLDILDLDIPAKDKVWVLTQPGVLSDALLKEFAALTADRAVRQRCLSCGLPAVEAWAVKWLNDSDRSAEAAYWTTRDAAYEAARNAAWAARAAYEAARNATRDAACDAARKAACGAAYEAVCDAAWAAQAAYEAVCDAAWAAQAAYWAARDAARVTAQAAYWAAQAAYWAAEAAYGAAEAAYGAERQQQVADLKRLIDA